MADPFNVQSSNSTIVWQAEPTTRGTFTIISTCVITLTLCVWTAVHLNLPRNDRGRWLEFLRRLGWLTCGLLAPEYLVLTAWTQRQAAKTVHKEVEDTLNSKKKAKGDPEDQILSRLHPWTMTHSFWAIMGGITIDPSGPNPFIPRDQQPTLTPQGISFLLKHAPQLLPDISEEDVKDKSKASHFTKSVACIQAIWFCLSCVARISQRLPVSLLEVNVFAHALCTILTYLIWWSKPFDVKQPFVLRDDYMRPLLAYMWMASKTSCIPKPKSQPHTTYKVGRDPEFEAITDDRASSTVAIEDSEVSNAIEIASDAKHSPACAPKPGSLNVAQPPIVTVTTSQGLSSVGFRVNGKSTRWKVTTTSSYGEGSSAKTYSHVSYKPAVFNLNPSDVQRWKLSREAMDKFRLQKPNINLDLVTLKPVPEFMDLDTSQGNYPLWQITAFSLVGACYGGLHALAWNSHFPTHRELVLWRASTLIIASPALFFISLILVVLVVMGSTLVVSSIFQLCRRKLNREVTAEPTQNSQPTTTAVKQETSLKRSTRLSKIAKGILSIFKTLFYALLMNSFIFLYLPARGYLVWESFRTTFFLPPEAYQATRWTQYLPHIS